ncbi:MAG: folylpolyglutamate synthase/dihydrofolate synthase family protein [Thermodesulfobacteriota bacterium]
MDYQQAWAYLDNLQFFKIKLGLDSMSEFLGRVGNPQDKLQCIHVGGTNGKGSVAMNLLTLLKAGGYRVGLYTSPHLSSVRERFRINDDYISEEDFAAIATEIATVLGDSQITYFEFTTALALLWFANQKVDLVILEVGLGGRLDATNVVKPLVSVITNVSMDHEAYLGTTLSEVAFEKAGIIKPGASVVSGVDQDVSREVVTARCAEMGAELWIFGREFSHEDNGDGSWTYQGVSKKISGLKCGMRGDYQRDNSSLALAVCELLEGKGWPLGDNVVRAQLSKVYWPGRLEYFCLDEEGRRLNEETLTARGRKYLLDGAHNPAGMESLCTSLRNEFSYKRLICVWAAMADKDLGTTLAAISPFCDIIIFTRPESERSATLEQLRGALEDFDGEIFEEPQVEGALQSAQDLAECEDLILVAGSLYLVGAARSQLLGEIV